jgi:hypothetical protein
VSEPGGAEQPLLSWVRRGPGGRPVDEELALYRRGSAWLGVRVAADPDREDRVGTFHATAGDVLLAAAVRLAAEVPALAVPARGAAAATAFAGGVRADLVPGVAGAAAELLALLDELTVRAIGEPVATCRFSLAPVATGAGPGFALVVTNDGTEPALITLDPAALAVEWRSGPTVQGRDAVPPLPIGLIDRDGELVDGLFVPASIAPQSSAALTLPLERFAGASAVAEIGGWIALRGPGTEPDIPLDRFSARSRPLEVSLAG